MKIKKGSQEHLDKLSKLLSDRYGLHLEVIDSMYLYDLERKARQLEQLEINGVDNWNGYVGIGFEEKEDDY